MSSSTPCNFENIAYLCGILMMDLLLWDEILNTLTDHVIGYNINKLIKVNYYG